MHQHLDHRPALAPAPVLATRGPLSTTPASCNISRNQLQDALT